MNARVTGTRLRTGSTDDFILLRLRVCLHRAGFDVDTLLAFVYARLRLWER